MEENLLPIINEAPLSCLINLFFIQTEILEVFLFMRQSVGAKLFIFFLNVMHFCA